VWHFERSVGVATIGMLTTPEHYRQKAHEARQHMDRSADPDVRQMWRNIAKQYEYLAEHVPQQEESYKAVQWPYNGA
jgi:hypothetical protein